VKALQRTSERAGHPLKLMAAVDAVNDAQKGVLASKITRRFGPDLSGRRFAIWGLAFKANTDDMREASILVLIAALLNSGAEVSAYDPVARSEAAKIFAGDRRVAFADNATAALEGCDALCIVTEWQEFRSPDFDALKAKLKTPAIFDGRNLYDPVAMNRLGIEYFPIGRTAGRPAGGTA